MLLQKLTLENFQGTKKLTFEFPGGCSASIYGDNATGKTTVFNAITWLLFDKPSTGAKGFTPTPRGPEGEIHKVDSTVTGEFITDGGRLITLSKTYKEIWKKKRGAIDATFAGHETIYSIDGVPGNKDTFDETILDMCGRNAEVLKILTMPDYFPEQMKWEDRRKILLEVCGDVTDEEVIASSADLKELPDFLRIPGNTEQMYSIDDYRKIAAAQRRDINAKLDILPARIDEVKRSIPEDMNEDPEELKKHADQITKDIESLMTEKAGIKSGDTATAQLHQQIAEKRAEMAEARAKYQEQANAANGALNSQIMAAQKEAQNLDGLRYEAKMKLAREEEHLAALQAKRDDTMTEYKKVAATKWNPDEEICPTCGQRLPSDKIADMKAHFNEERSKKLEQLNTYGKTACSKEMVAASEKTITELKLDIEEHNKAINEAKQKASDLQAQLTATVPFEQTPEYNGFLKAISGLMQSETNAMGATDEMTKAIDEKIAAKRAELNEVQTKQLQIENVKAAEARAAKLEQDQRELSAAFDKTEKGLYLSDLFIKTKVKMLTNRINSKFKTVSFQLFVTQINGGVKEGCEVLVPGPGGQMIPYAYANNAARINAGLEIIGTLSDHWGFKAPVIIDNCEAISHPLEINTQEIKLYVSEPDKVLKLELDK